MKVEVTIERDDVTEAVIEWFKKQPVAQHCKDKEIVIGWTGGSVVLANLERRTDRTGMEAA